MLGSGDNISVYDIYRTQIYSKKKKEKRLYNDIARAYNRSIHCVAQEISIEEVNDMFQDGFIAILVFVVILLIYGRLKYPNDKTARLTKRLDEFNTAKLGYKKHSLLYQIKHFFRIN